MGPRGLYIVRFNKRYFVRHVHHNSSYHDLGCRIVDTIPTDPEQYQNWLMAERKKYQEHQDHLEARVYTIRDGIYPDYDLYRPFTAVPSELPRLDGFEAEYVYIVNLDCEILTMNYTIHWKLDRIPRRDSQWLRAIRSSIYSQRPTIHPGRCPVEFMAAPAVPHRLDNTMRFAHAIVRPRRHIAAAHEFFCTRMAAGVLAEYVNEIIRFGLEWTPDMLPFREMAYAIVSLVAAGSDSVRFHAFPPRPCNPRDCRFVNCAHPILPRLPGYLGANWVGARAPLCEFGSSAHLPGQLPGAAPVETTYWLGGVVVHLTMAVDEGSISAAVAWAWDQGHRHFQAVVLSLFHVVLAEVRPRDQADEDKADEPDEPDEPFVRLTRPIPLSPLAEVDCNSSHPLRRPVRPHGEFGGRAPGTHFFYSYCQQLNQQVLQARFPGLVGLVHFFEAAAARRAATKVVPGMRVDDDEGVPPTGGIGRLPAELYSLILDHVDYDTWKSCLTVSHAFRRRALDKFRIDDRFRIVGGPFMKRNRYYSPPYLAFDFEDLQTGTIVPAIEEPRKYSIQQMNWMPILGQGARQVLMLDMFVQFQPCETTVGSKGKRKMITQVINV